MKSLMHDARGVGLAATQVGVLRRLFVFSDEDTDHVLVNPRIVEMRRRRRERRGGLPLARPGARAGRAVGRHHDRGAGPHRSTDPDGAGVHGGSGGAARDRPPGRGADRPADGRRVAARGARPAAAAAGHRRRVTRMRLAVAATAPFGADVLERLASRCDVAALLTRPDRPAGRGRRVSAPPAKVTAERLGIPVLQPERPTAELELPADTVVVCAYGLLIPESLLERGLWLNVHPSLLPRWRGAAPVERAIMAGDTETGVTIHETVKELDAGPVAAQRAFPIGAEDDAGAVYAHAAETAADLLAEVLARALVHAAGRGRRHLCGEDRGGRPRARPLAPGAGARRPRTGAVAAHRRPRRPARPPRDRVAGAGGGGRCLRAGRGAAGGRPADGVRGVAPRAAMTDRWPPYFAAAGDEPRETLLEALIRFEAEGRILPGAAVDLGAGTGRGTPPSSCAGAGPSSPSTPIPTPSSVCARSPARHVRRAAPSAQRAAGARRSRRPG